jgi:aminopeptidase N
VLREFTRNRAFERVTWDEFLKAIERGAGRDLQWFYEQWFERTGVPEWQLNWRQEGEMLLGEITQAAPYFRATLEVEAKNRDGRTQSLSLEVDGPKMEFAMRLGFGAQTVQLDPHYKVIRWTPEYRDATSKLSPNR